MVLEQTLNREFGAAVYHWKVTRLKPLTVTLTIFTGVVPCVDNNAHWKDGGVIDPTIAADKLDADSLGANATHHLFIVPALLSDSLKDPSGIMGSKQFYGFVTPGHGPSVDALDAAHELGHGLGLEHILDTRNLMYGVALPPGNQLWITQRDVMVR